MSDPEAIIEEIGRLEEVRYRAMLEGDLDTLAPLLSERLRYVHSRGGVDTKADFLGKLRDGGLIYHSLHHPVERVTVLEGAVLVAGHMSGEATLNGHRGKLNNSCLVVWAREGEGWALVAYQPTPLPA